MSSSTVIAPTAWQAAIDLARLHDARSPAEVDADVLAQLAAWLPDHSGALLLHDSGNDHRLVRGVFGLACPWLQDEVVPTGSWPESEGHGLPVCYRKAVVGELRLSAPVPMTMQPAVASLLTHYGVAMVNLTLDAESRQATDHYCASLQALEEGMVLLQEGDPESVMARLLGLATTMLQAQAGALYVLSQIGDEHSALRLQQALGVPEALLQSLRGEGGVEWPRCLLQRQAFHQSRTDAPSLGGLDSGCVPSFLRDLVALPLRYHGVVAGVMVLFNVDCDDSMHRGIDRLQSLSHLAAALLHRISLEATSAQNLSIAKELAIAEAIQKRLLPSQKPRAPGFDFAWRSVAAQHIGGDYLDVLTSDLGDIYALIADASGHGINSALLMSSFRATWRAEAPWVEPTGLAARLNRDVCDEVGATGMFITAATLRIEVESRRLNIASAGHNPLYLFRAATETIQTIDSNGPPLGFLAGCDYGCHDLQLAAGDVLLLYTDGISEAMNLEGDMFGEERLQAVLREHRRDPPSVLLEVLLQQLHQFTGRTRQDDDVSLLVIKML